MAIDDFPIVPHKKSILLVCYSDLRISAATECMQ